MVVGRVDCHATHHHVGYSPVARRLGSWSLLEHGLVRHDRSGRVVPAVRLG